MKCSNCNHEYDDNINFCPLCGYVQETIIVESQDAQNGGQTQQGGGDAQWQNNAQPNQDNNAQWQGNPQPNQDNAQWQNNAQPNHGNNAPRQDNPPRQDAPPHHQHEHHQHSALPPQVVTGGELQSARNNATASLVCGILAFVIPFVGVILAIVALVLGNSARRRLPESERSVASAGFILGIVSLVFSIIVIAMVLWLVGVMVVTSSSIIDYLDPYYWRY